MKRLIYAEDVKEQIDEWLEVVGTACVGKGLSYYYELLGCIEDAPTVEAVPVVRGEWVYWKEQCEYCMNRNTCPYTENQESMEALKQWEKENKFYGSLKLICDYYVLDKDKYYLDNPPECNAEGCEKND